MIVITPKNPCDADKARVLEFLLKEHEAEIWQEFFSLMTLTCPHCNGILKQARDGWWICRCGWRPPKPVEEKKD